MADDKCEVLKFYAPEDTFGGNKPTVPCDPGTIRVPDELREPTGEAPPQQPYAFPKATLIWNHAKAYTCKLKYLDDAVNANVYDEVPSVVEDGAMQDKLSVATYDLGLDKLDYIARHGLEIIYGEEFHRRWIPEAKVPELDENGTVIAVLQGQSGISAQETADLLHIPISIATTLNADMERTQRALNDYALRQAELGVICYWFNTQQYARCSITRAIEGIDPSTGEPVYGSELIPLEDYATSDEYPGANPEAYTEANVIKSYEGQEDADRRALELAESALNCLFLSDPQEADCSKDLGYIEPIPVETVSYVDGMPPRVGTFAVGKGAYTSTISKEEANNLAKEFALSNLNCYYYNLEVSRRCAHTGARNPGKDPSQSVATTANWESGIPGQAAYIAQGSIWSDSPTDTTEKLTDNAVELAEALVTCCFMSPAVRAVCSDIKDPETGLVVAKPNEQKSFVYSVSYAPGTIMSCLEGADRFDPAAANALVEKLEQEVQTMAQNALQCTYCNHEVPPSCVPNWVLSALEAGELTIPINVFDGSLDNAYNQHGKSYQVSPVDETIAGGTLGDTTETNTCELSGALQAKDWSDDATVGAAANTYCAEIRDETEEMRYKEWLSLQQLAEAAASDRVVDRTAPSGNLCYFGNFTVIGGCESSGSAKCDPDDPDCNNEGSKQRQCNGCIPLVQGAECGSAQQTNMEYGCTGDGTPFIKAVMRSDYDFRSGGATIPANTIRVAASSPEEYESAQQMANKQAVELAQASASCGWCNCRTRAACWFADTHYDKISANSSCSNWTFGISKPIPRDHLAPGATNMEVVIEPCVVTSYKCKMETYEAVRNMALSMLNCFAGNDELSGGCNADQVGGSYLIPKNTVIATSKQEANARARSLLNGVKTCLFCNGSRINSVCYSIKKQEEGEEDKPKEYEVDPYMELIRAGIVPACTVVSALSKDDANAKADELAKALTICLPPGVGGGGGGGGYGGGCVCEDSGSCNAVYA